MEYGMMYEFYDKIYDTSTFESELLILSIIFSFSLFLVKYINFSIDVNE